MLLQTAPSFIECCSLISGFLNRTFLLLTMTELAGLLNSEPLFVRMLLIPCTSQLSRPAIFRAAITINRLGWSWISEYLVEEREASKFGRPSRHHSRVWFHNLHDRHMHVLTFVYLSDLTFSLLEGFESQS